MDLERRTPAPWRTTCTGARLWGCGLELRERLVVERSPCGIVEGPWVRNRAGRAISRSAHAERKHQYRLVVFDEDDAAVLGAVVRDEANATRWARHLRNPVRHDTKSGTSLVNGAKEHVDEGVA